MRTTGEVGCEGEISCERREVCGEQSVHLAARYLKTHFPSSCRQTQRRRAVGACLPLLAGSGCAAAGRPSMTGQYRHSIYTGLGGVAVALLRAVSTAATYAATRPYDRVAARSRTCGHLRGAGGRGAMRELLLRNGGHASGRVRRGARAGRELVRRPPARTARALTEREDAAEDEMLFGKAGWMYCLRFVQRSLGDFVDEGRRAKSKFASAHRRGTRRAGREVARNADSSKRAGR